MFSGGFNERVSICRRPRPPAAPPSGGGGGGGGGGSSSHHGGDQSREHARNAARDVVLDVEGADEEGVLPGGGDDAELDRLGPAEGGAVAARGRRRRREAARPVEVREQPVLLGVPLEEPVAQRAGADRHRVGRVDAAVDVGAARRAAGRQQRDDVERPAVRVPDRHVDHPLERPPAHACTHSGAVHTHRTATLVHTRLTPALTGGTHMANTGTDGWYTQQGGTHMWNDVHATRQVCRPTEIFFTFMQTRYMYLHFTRSNIWAKGNN